MAERKPVDFGLIVKLWDEADVCIRLGTIITKLKDARAEMSSPVMELAVVLGVFKNVDSRYVYNGYCVDFNLVLELAEDADVTIRRVLEVLILSKIKMTKPVQELGVSMGIYDMYGIIPTDDPEPNKDGIPNDCLDREALERLGIGG